MGGDAAQKRKQLRLPGTAGPAEKFDGGRNISAGCGQQKGAACDIGASAGQRSVTDLPAIGMLLQLCNV
ncbi:hypothetical protein SDC9_165465 [bioreactor metagenome]|uniref:Uncharacterized protein n=1 Tax=bioreactor metagenome TaxID=1076179 RepID=A0A645FUD1_9ZZZZ